MNGITAGLLRISHLLDRAGHIHRVQHLSHEEIVEQIQLVSRLRPQLRPSWDSLSVSVARFATGLNGLLARLAPSPPETESEDEGVEDVQIDTEEEEIEPAHPPEQPPRRMPSASGSIPPENEPAQPPQPQPEDIPPQAPTRNQSPPVVSSSSNVDAGLRYDPRPLSENMIREFSRWPIPVHIWGGVEDRRHWPLILDVSIPHSLCGPNAFSGGVLRMFEVDSPRTIHVSWIDNGTTISFRKVIRLDLKIGQSQYKISWFFGILPRLQGEVVLGRDLLGRLEARMSDIEIGGNGQIRVQICGHILPVTRGLPSDEPDDEDLEADGA